jgi:TRAP transporter 4TM/12TM fusion protein
MSDIGNVKKAGEGKIRALDGKIFFATNLVAIGFSLFYIYTCAFGLISSQLHRGAYLLFTFPLCLLLYPVRRDTGGTRVPLLDWGLLVITLGSVGYWLYEYPSYAYRIGDPQSMDIVMGAIVILLSLEVARRVVGWVLPLLAVIALLYAYLGPYVPGVLGHFGFGVQRIVEYTAVGMGGIYGIVTNTYATFIFPFIVFASFLQAAGGGAAIEEISSALAGGTRGGPAKVAVVSSGFIGSVTGSSAANAVVTGSYTIPLMIKTGYKPQTAAAIEAAASTGGQFMPPIMGAAAFLIASFTETPYLEVIKISAYPALLYFVGVGMMVHFVAAREGLKGLPKEQLPKIKQTFIRRGYMLLPIIMILTVLVAGYSAQLAAVVAIAFTIGLSYIRKDTRMGPKKIVAALIQGAKNSLAVGATAGVIGIMMAIVTMTGLGIKFSSVVISMSGGFLPLTVLLVAVAGYLLGMGVTITATYILLSVLAVPALMELGIPLITAHLVAFWFCETGGVTPPVALVAFAASSIAKCNPYKAGVEAVRLASPLFIIPMLFIYTPILMDGPLPNVMETMVSCLIGMTAYAGMMQGYWSKRVNLLERLLLGVAAVCLFVPNVYSDLAGVLVLVLVTLINRRKEDERFKTLEYEI